MRACLRCIRCAVRCKLGARGGTVGAARRGLKVGWAVLQGGPSSADQRTAEARGRGGIWCSVGRCELFLELCICAMVKKGGAFLCDCVHKSNKALLAGPGGGGNTSKCGTQFAEAAGRPAADVSPSRLSVLRLRPPPAPPGRRRAPRRPGPRARVRLFEHYTEHTKLSLSHGSSQFAVLDSFMNHGPYTWH